ncbi:MAG: CocE/NonD family hydrolase [Chitinophagaceae bacterium]|nr:MAG: CocE/NonD family hydrolase [Chitinophagaceae bacterium]
MKKYIHFLHVVIFSMVAQFATAQNLDSAFVAAHYSMAEYEIPMRDGIKLFTIVYTPKDQTKKYPFIINRTCYNASNYAHYNFHSHPSDFLIRDGYIFVFQDVRGRYMSEGVFNNMTPNIPNKSPKNKKAIDESSDTWDSIDWLVKNIKGNNGKAGIMGISYPGYYSTASLPEAHPALKAVSPQAPISDFFFDDFHHNGVYLESYSAAFPVFGIQKTSKTKENWFNADMMKFFSKPVPDGYQFYLDMGPIKNITQKYYQNNFFWKQIIDHPNYDSFWQKRNILPHLKNIKPAVMVVGGWFDAEDLAGPLKTFKTINQNSPTANNTIVMGPWGHGDWARESGKSTHNHLYFGDSISTYYMRDVELPFFQKYLKDAVTPAPPKALMYNTGTKEWERFSQWPVENIATTNLYFNPDFSLTTHKRAYDTTFSFSYISDPAKPVPYRSQIEGLTFTPRLFMSDDQREAGRRTDVLTFKTDILKDDMKLSGEILAKLIVSMTGTDADFIVKLIDVYPDNTPRNMDNPANIVMGGYQQLVRSEVFRGRFRNSFEHPEPFTPGKKETVAFKLQDILHTFKKGHRVMIQIHSTWFPYIDRNPQKYVDNIYKADEKDFIKSTITIYPESVISINGKQ